MADVEPQGGILLQEAETAADRADAAAALPKPRGLRLAAPAGPRWITFPERPGIRMRVKPLTTPLHMAARAASERRLRDLFKSEPAHPAKGDSDMGVGLMFTWQAEELARVLVEEWEGVELEDGSPAPVTPQTIAAMMAHPDVAADFMVLVRRPLDDLANEGKG